MVMNIIQWKNILETIKLQFVEVRGRGFTMEKLRYDELNQNKNGNMG